MGMRKGLKRVISNVCIGILVVGMANCPQVQSLVTGSDNAVIQAQTDGVYTQTGYKLNYTKYSNYVKITGFEKTTNSNSLVVTIPDYIGGMKVTTIGAWAFFNSDVYRVNLPSTITTLENYAFYNCENLYTLSLSKNLNGNISGYKVFDGCDSLCNLIVPSDMTNFSIMEQLKCTYGGARWIKNTISARTATVYNQIKSRNSSVKWNLSSMTSNQRETAKYAVANTIRKELLRNYVSYDSSSFLGDTAYSLVSGSGNSAGLSRAYIQLLLKAGFYNSELQLLTKQGNLLVGMKIGQNWFITDCTSTNTKTLCMNYFEWGWAQDGVVRGYIDYDSYVFYAPANEVKHEGDQLDGAADVYLRQRYGASFRGDVDESGFLDMADVATLNKYLADTSKGITFSAVLNPVLADMNQDGLINQEDLALLSEESMSSRK